MYSRKEVSKGVRLLGDIAKHYKDESPAKVAEGVFSYFQHAKQTGIA